MAKMVKNTAFLETKKPTLAKEEVKVKLNVIDRVKNISEKK